MDELSLDLLTPQRREVKILEILRFYFEGKNLREACEAADVPVSTYYDWRQKGYVLAAYRQISDELGPRVYDQVLPRYNDFVQTVLNAALGLPPPLNPDLKITESGMAKAWAIVQQWLPVQPIDQAGESQSAAEFLEKFVPKGVWVQRTTETAAFLYSEGDDNARMGKMPSIADEIEGDYEEV
jgi:hypothetical protein